jgi:transcriptional regulator with GAF, ATPase, and Fis domain
LGFRSTISAGTSVQEPRKLIIIHRARSSPISEQKRMLENAQHAAPSDRVTAVKATALPAVAAYKRELLLRALAQAQGNHAVAAKTLGLQRTYLQRLLKALRIG